MRSLTTRQARFAEQFMIDGNATRAAKLAGYSHRSAHVTGSRLLGNVNVAAAIAKATKDRNDAVGIDARWVLLQAQKIYERCMQEVRPALDPRSRKQMMTAEGEPLFTFNAPAATRALELIGKHVEIGAFESRVAVRGEVDVISRLQAGRNRVRALGLHDVDKESVTP